ASLSLLFAAAGCAVGPDYKKPTPPDVQAYNAAGMPQPTVEAKTPGGAAQKFVPGEDIPAEWWVLFQSEALNKVITKALKASPDLQAAEAALREAEENLKAQEGTFFPSLDGSAGTSREKASGTTTAGSPKPSFSLYNASVSVSYPLDVFGGVRRGVEVVEAQAEAQRYQLEAAYLTLTSNIVTAAIQEASLREQIAATQDIIGAERKQLNLLQKQLDLGGISRADVLAQAAKLAQTEATLPALEKQLAQTRNSLAALTGQYPSEELGATFTLDSLHLPESLPVSLPSQLVEQRPDVQAAASQLHAASAEIGVATANMLPQLTLNASYGLSAVSMASLFTPGSAVWSVGASLLQPLFRGGELEHKRRASEAAFDKTAAQYRSTVLGAFKNVADSLRALETDAVALKAQLAAERAAANSLKLSRDQYNAGAISYLSLLAAEQTYEQARIGLAQAKAARFADTAALFQALGGGWWNRQPVAEAGQEKTEVKAESGEKK
ncbi:MAG: efflux transporter outer membrane subunit, partial [Alphaproteobacteria bacterium]|nr:efflux transporter outer membrane subunit [Alphaproteobacteria bacterium]